MNFDNQHNTPNDGYQWHQIESHLIEAHQTWELPSSVSDQIESLFDEPPTDTADDFQTPKAVIGQDRTKVNSSVWKTIAIAASISLFLTSVYTLVIRETNVAINDPASQQTAGRPAPSLSTRSSSGAIEVTPVELSKHIRSPGKHFAMIIPTNDEEIEVVQLLPIFSPNEENH